MTHISPPASESDTLSEILARLAISPAQSDTAHNPGGRTASLLGAAAPVPPYVGRRYLLRNEDPDLARRINDQLAAPNPLPRPAESRCDEPSNAFIRRSLLAGNPPKKWRITMGEFKDKVEGKTDEAIGNVKQESGNPDTRAEGKTQEEKGELQQEKGKLEGATGNDI